MKPIGAFLQLLVEKDPQQSSAFQEDVYQDFVGGV